MRRAVVVHADARRDLIEARDYIDGQRDGYGFLFTEAIERELGVLAEFPLIGKRFDGGYRRRSMPDWHYGIYYAVREADVVVVAVVHDRRDPKVIRDRLRYTSPP
jgi:plasmid stabilization system protein ParE